MMIDGTGTMTDMGPILPLKRGNVAGDRTMMKAAVIRAHGAPDVLKIEDMPRPEPGPEQVLVRVGAVGVSYHDVVERNGTYRPEAKFPMVLGYEIAGTVEQLGQRVTSLNVGDRVCCKAHHSCGRCRYCRTGMETACERRRPVHGGYAEYVVLPDEVLVKLDDRIDFARGCMLGPTVGVALNAVRDVAKVRLADTVLVTGASGGLGIPSIELSKAAGATVIALTRSAAKVAELQALGADHVLVADGTDFSTDVMPLTRGMGVDVVIDNVGSRVFTPCFKSLAMGGRYAFVGQLMKEQISINPARIFFRRAQLLGVGSVRRDQLEDAVQLVAGGRIHAHVAQVLPLAEAARAHALVEAGTIVGRIVLVP
jgi:NADPH:quinone reductase-like Zn-dependent oxidoreductase